MMRSRSISIRFNVSLFVAGMTVLVVPLPAAANCKIAKTQREIEQCMAKELAAVQAELDRTYASYLASLTGEDRSRLEKAQRAWERYRDLNCDAASGMYGVGTMAATEFAACKLKLTSERLEELKRIYAEPPHPVSPPSK